MDVLEVNAATYGSVITDPYVVFNGASFNELNSHKCDAIKFLLLRDSEYRFGIIFGCREGDLFSPFSAPYGGLTPISQKTRTVHYEQAIAAITGYAERIGARSLNLTLPPCFYAESALAKQINALHNQRYEIILADLDLFYDLADYSADYPSSIARNSRKNLKTAMAASLGFSVNGPDSLACAYSVVRRNREAKGYPLQMSYDQVLLTTKLIPTDAVIVSKDDIPLAAAMVFKVNDAIRQVIYWGAVPEGEHLRPVNYLAYKLFEYYKSNGPAYVDIGPSSAKSIPNHGLLDFKEGLGCRISLKFGFRKVFS